MAWWRTLAVAAMGYLLAMPAAHAAGSYDPNLEYRTLSSGRLAVHYPPGAFNLAVRVARLGNEILRRDADLFGFTPEGPLQVVLTDFTDTANGSAQVLPQNRIILYLAAPTELTGLSAYDDWLTILLTHEIAHICDLDQTHNFTRGLRAVFGKYIQWNAYVPQFLSEGVAVYAETKLTRTGRGRSSYVEMLLRVAALDDGGGGGGDGRFLAIDQANILFPDWPGGNVAYFYGGRFHLWLADTLGEAAVPALHHYYAAQVLPYFYWFGAKAILGASLPDLWERWRQDERTYAQEVQRNVQAAGLTASRRLTFHGRDITGARYAPDGNSIIYSRSSPVDGSTVRRMDRNGQHDNYLVLATFSPRFTFDPTGQQFIYSQAAINDRFDSWNDLYRYDIRTDSITRLFDRQHPNRRLRARDPAVSPDGQSMVFVQIELQQSWLTLAALGGEHGNELTLTTLVGPVGEVQHASPAFSPDGTRLAESVWTGDGRRDIVVLDARTGSLVRRITYDAAQDGNPAWSRDGRYVLYESDADGISNLYAYDLQACTYYRITHVVGGAFQPDVSPDGQFLLFRNASGVGFDIHEMPFDPNAWEPQGYVPGQGYSPLPAPQALEDAPWMHLGLGPSLARANEPAVVLHADETDAPYTPLPTLLPFQYNGWLLPNIYFSNLTTLSQLARTEVGLWLTVGGEDALERHNYRLSVGVSRYGNHPNWQAQYINDVWFPTLALSVSDIATQYLVPGARPVELDRTASGSVSALFLQRHQLIGSYTFQHRSSSQANAASLALGKVGYVNLAYQYSYAFSYPYSVGLEHGESLAASLRWYAKALGSDFEEVMLNVDGRLYLNNPLFDNHVLALRLATALALGPEYRENYYLGGTSGSSFLTSQSPRQYPLRGFNGQLPGSGVVALYSEYRFPLWHVSRGLVDDSGVCGEPQWPAVLRRGQYIRQ